MAEVFVPSTTGEGQGAAQIFQSNPQFADASGIVRGIERGAASLAKRREQQYEEEKERVKKQQELNSKIADARKATGVATIDKAVNKIYEIGIKDAYRLDNDDPTGTMQQTLDKMNNVKDVAYPIFSKGLENSKSEIEKAGGASAYGDEGWGDALVAPTFGDALTGNLYTDEEIQSKIEGGTLLTDLVADFSAYKENPNFHINSDVTSMASTLKENLIGAYGAKEENLKNPSVIGGRDVVYKISDFTPASKAKMKQEAQNNPQLKTAYRNQKMRQENLSPTEFDKKYPPEVFNAMFLEDTINPMFEGATTEVLSTKKDEGNKGITEQEVNVKGTDVRKEGSGYKKTDIEEIGINVLKEGSKTTEQPVTVSVGNKQRNGFIKAVTKDPEGNVLVKVEYKENGQVKSGMYPVDEVREYLTEAQINEIQAKGGDVNISTSYDLESWIDDVTYGLTANKDIAKDLVFFIPNATNITDPENSSDDVAFTIGEESYSFNLEDNDDLATFKELVKNNSGKVGNTMPTTTETPIKTTVTPR